MKKIFLVFCLFFSLNSFAEIVIVVNQKLPFVIEKKDISKIYLGKIFTLNSITLIPISLNEKSLKNEFLDKYLNLTEEQYTAYWTVRQYIGRGTTLVKEFENVDEIIDFVENNIGAIAYLDEKMVNKYSNNKIKIILKDIDNK